MAKESSQLSSEDLDSLLANVKEEEPKPSSLEQEGNLPNLEGQQDQTGMGLDQESLDALVDSLGTETKEEKKAWEGASIADLSTLSKEPAPTSNRFDNLDLVKDVRLRFTVELGRSKILIKDVLKLGEGSVVVLDRDEGEDVDILVNDRLFGRGKLKLVGEYFGIQITKIEDKMMEYRK